VSVHALSTHATYRCRHAGACCTAGWRIPVDVDKQQWLGVASLVPDATGACRFYDRPSGLCQLQRDHGAAALPRACDQFPRLSLRDRRGTFVTLSHFCPTAARLLVEDTAPLRIVKNPAAFPQDRFYDALDAEQEWPPLLRPSVLCDLDTYSRWEDFLVGTFADETLSIEAQLNAVAWTAEALRSWSPSQGDLSDHADDVFARARITNRRPDIYHPFTDPAVYATVLGFVRREEAADESNQTSTDVASHPIRHWGKYAPAVARYLAAKAFGSWSAYQGRGVRTLVAELMVAETIVGIEAARRSAPLQDLTSDIMVAALGAADWLLIHSVDRAPFVQWLGRVETAAGSLTSLASSAVITSGPIATPRVR
jgi:hypothetical protein